MNQKKKQLKAYLNNLQIRNQYQQKNSQQEPLLGVDYGDRFCGIAFSPDGSCVFPVGVSSTDGFLEKIEQEINDRSVKTVVLGLPISPNKQENQVCKTIRVLGNTIKRQCNVKVVFQDEKFSTQEGLKFKSKKEKRADHLAAAKILEYYLGY